MANCVVCIDISKDNTKCIDLQDMLSQLGQDSCWSSGPRGFKSHPGASLIRAKSQRRQKGGSWYIAVSQNSVEETYPNFLQRHCNESVIALHRYVTALLPDFHKTVLVTCILMSSLPSIGRRRGND